MPNSHFLSNRRSGIAVTDILGRARRPVRSLLRWHHIRCCTAATLLTVVMVAAATITSPVAAQLAQDDTRLPNAGEVESAFQTLRGWVDAFETPRMDGDESRAMMTGATGVSIVLRRFGRVMGVGSDATGDDLMLRRAAGRALNDVLSDPALSSLSSRLRQQEVQDPESALTVDALRAELGRTLSIELEVAGRLSPMVGRSVEQLARKLQPGIHGVALRDRQSLELLYPSQLRVTNTGGDPSRLLLNLAMKAGLPVKDLGELPKRDDLAIYSFQTITLWQGSPNESPQRTLRGDTPVPLDTVNAESMLLLADGLASHLLASIWPEPPPPPRDPELLGPQSPPTARPNRDPLGIMGDYSIVADQYRPPIAPPLDQALAAFALHRYAMATEHGIDDIRAAEALNGAAIILRDLAIVTPAEGNPLEDLAACAAIIYAVTEQSGVLADPGIHQLFTEATSRVAGSFEPESGFLDRSAVDGRARGVAAHAQAMLAGAMARLLAFPNPTPLIDEARVRLAIDAAWRSVAESQHIALLPWIGWAEADYAQVTDRQLQRLDELLLMIEALDRARLDDSGAVPADMVGGFSLIGENQRGVPTATSQTVRPAAWLASAIHERQLVAADQAAVARERHLETIRFLIQLSVREVHRGWLRNPTRAIGGLRAALWDSDQPVPAQALGLIAATETIRHIAEQSR